MASSSSLLVCLRSGLWFPRLFPEPYSQINPQTNHHDLAITRVFIMRKENQDSHVLGRVRIHWDGLWLKTRARIYKLTGMPMKYHLIMWIGHMPIGPDTQYTKWSHLDIWMNRLWVNWCTCIDKIYKKEAWSWTSEWNTQILICVGNDFTEPRFLISTPTIHSSCWSRSRSGYMPINI